MLKTTVFVAVFFCLSKMSGQDTLQVSTDTMSKGCRCLRIKTNGLYQSEDSLKANLFENIWVGGNWGCYSFVLPKVNFRKKNVLWFDLGASGVGQPIIETHLYKIPSKKKYYYLIKITQKSNVSVGHPVFIRETTKKLEKGYTFEYKIESIVL